MSVSSSTPLSFACSRKLTKFHSARGHLREKRQRRYLKVEVECLSFRLAILPISKQLASVNDVRIGEWSPAARGPAASLSDQNALPSENLVGDP
jgi:hypothetical protein